MKKVIIEQSDDDGDFYLINEQDDREWDEGFRSYKAAESFAEQLGLKVVTSFI